MGQKHTLLFTFLLCFSFSYSATYSTISDGAWNNAGTWSPSVPPNALSAGDTIVVSHVITTSFNININGVIQVDSLASLSGNHRLRAFAGAFIFNSGTISINRLTNQGTGFNHANALINTTTKFINSGTFTNSGSINTDEDLENDSGTFINLGNITINDDLDNVGGLFIENGTTSVADEFDNANGTINGSGSLCVEDRIFNATGGILGDLDICHCSFIGNPIVGGGLVEPSVIICGILLPVGLSEFSATVPESRIKFEWTTITETNNDFFTIEESMNGIDWIPIAIVDGAGNSSSEVQYEYLGAHPNSGISYYRLKQTDFNGADHSYSDVISLLSNIKPKGNIKVYPNHANQGETVTVMISGWSSSFRITSLDGKIIQSENYHPQWNKKAIIQLAPDFSKGTYIISCSERGNTVMIVH